jgi:predicted nucleic acid-binding protein
MQVLLDTNVLLDSLLQRAPWHVDSDAILRAAAAGQVTCAAASLSLANVFYVVRRLEGATKARAAVRTCLRAFDILAVDAQTVVAADALPGADFEDNIQISAAVRTGLDAIVTRDPAGFAASPIPVLSPTDLLALLASKSPPTAPSAAESDGGSQDA